MVITFASTMMAGAVGCLALAAFGVKWKNLNLFALGMALWAISLFVQVSGL